MGNHDAGRAMGTMVLSLIERRRDGESPLSILDLACEPWRGCDAEFEAVDPNDPRRIHPDYGDYRFPPSPMAKLLVEAFSPNGLEDWDRYSALFERDRRRDQSPEVEQGVDDYWDDVIRPFKNRYDLC